VVFSGFNVTSTAAVSYKNTDLELVLGTQSALPSRYSVGNNWGRRWPHAIDPCVFYDEDGRLWMSYGSWSGGIWILRLNEENGLRDYDVKYPSTGGNTDGVTSDPYFGTKIAGGYYVSGEGSYIEYVGGYYFLFISNGGLTAGGNASDYNNGGYQMRVFRSQKPDGPYRDASNVSAIYTQFKTNFGPGCDTRGVNIFGAYGNWGYQATGKYSERSQGHNSIIAAEDGRTYLVYHTRFQDLGEGHEVRVHQVFQNQDGWLVAAPFEYTGETVTSADIAATQQIATADIPGTYQLLYHKYGLDHRKKEYVTPEEIVLHADGTITGSRSGKWQITEGKSYITLTLGGIVFKGVMVEQTMEPKSTKTAAFTALTRSGVTVWGYRSGDDPTGIKEYVATKSQQTMQGDLFDLQGRRVTKVTGKGIYIENGRKRVIK
jgi:arabinan endo-1,5-alpha-L-arabinosidase